MRVEQKDDLNIRLLEIFSAVLAEQTTTGAAEAMGISQPAVSNAVARLEGQTGLNLFERSGRGLVPTEEARLLMQEVEPLTSLLGNLESSIRKIRSTNMGNLRILATPPMGHTVLPAALRDFVASRSDIRVRYDICSLQRVTDGVRKGLAETGFILGSVNEDQLNVVHLKDEPLYCVVPSNHSLADADSIQPADLMMQPLIGVESSIGALVQASFVKARVSYEPAMEVRDCHTACVLANAGVGVTVVDGFSARFIGNLDVVIKPYLPETLVPASAIYRRGSPLSGVVDEFVESARAQMRRKE